MPLKFSSQASTIGQSVIRRKARYQVRRPPELNKPGYTATDMVVHGLADKVLQVASLADYVEIFARNRQVN